MHKLGAETFNLVGGRINSNCRCFNFCLVIQQEVTTKDNLVGAVSTVCRSGISQVECVCCFQSADNTTISFNNLTIHKGARDLLQLTPVATTSVSNETTSVGGATFQHVTNSHRVVTCCEVESSKHLSIKDPQIIGSVCVFLNLCYTSTTNHSTCCSVSRIQGPVIIHFKGLIC